jgi:hypothetical protein
MKCPTHFPAATKRKTKSGCEYSFLQGLAELRIYVPVGEILKESHLIVALLMSDAIPWLVSS